MIYAILIMNIILCLCVVPLTLLLVLGVVNKLKGVNSNAKRK